MRFFVFFIFAGFAALFYAERASASSLDELYRDIIRSDNRGYLPLFVKNRQTPDHLFLSEEDLASVPKTKPDDKTAKTIKLSNDFQRRSILMQARQRQWLKTIAAVKANQVTPLELNDITTRAQENDPKATEILAWMYTKGVGVAPDFVAAFNLYKKAASLNVANAEQNALSVYKSMNEEQRRKVKNTP